MGLKYHVASDRLISYTLVNTANRYTPLILKYFRRLTLSLAASFLTVGSNAEVIIGHSHVLTYPFGSAGTPALEMFFEKLEGTTPEHEIKIEAVELGRSLRQISQGRADFQYPIVCSDLSKEANDFLKVGRKSFGFAPFIIISSKNKPISRKDLDNALYHLAPSRIKNLAPKFTKKERDTLKQASLPHLKKDEFLNTVSDLLKISLSKNQTEALLQVGFPYKVVTDRATRYFIPYITTPGNSLLASIKMTIAGRADAVIDSIYGLQGLLPKIDEPEKLSIQLFENFDLCYVVANSERGRTIDEILSRSIEQIEHDEELSRAQSFLRDKTNDFIKSALNQKNLNAGQKPPNDPAIIHDALH